jgi:hypothetical protein
VTHTLAHPYDSQATGRSRKSGRPKHSTERGRRHDTGAVGLNPFRQHRRSPADILMVAGALLVCVALVAWALLG